MKNKRHEAILELIKSEICLTQEDLQNGLNKLGFNVTQSTVSRDIRELKLSKGRDEKGNYRYLSSEINSKKDDANHYKTLFLNSVNSIAYSINNVVIKCKSGMASSVCVAVDEMFGDMMLGSISGDDTIIIVTASESDSKDLTDSLNELKG